MTLTTEYQRRKDALDKKIQERRKLRSQTKEKSESKKKARQSIVANARALRRLKNELEIFIKAAKETHGRVDKLVRKIEKEYWI